MESKEYTRVGGGWIQESKRGKYISVKLDNGMRLSIFRNDKKEKETQPDYSISTTTEVATQYGLLKEESALPENQTEKINLDDIPF